MRGILGDVLNLTRFKIVKFNITVIFSIMNLRSVHVVLISLPVNIKKKVLSNIPHLRYLFLIECSDSKLK